MRSTSNFIISGRTTPAGAGGGASLARLALLVALPIGLTALGLAVAGRVLDASGGRRREGRGTPLAS
jgi:hypothetical protein